MTSRAPKSPTLTPSISVFQMGGEGPYVKFSNEEVHLRTTSRPPSPLSDKELDEAYARAHPFLLERVRQLVRLGWEQHETDDASLASLSYTRVNSTNLGDRRTRVELRLPRTASALFDPRLFPRWKDMFERWELFNPRRRRRSTSPRDRDADAYLSVDVEAPLRDVFNVLQCLVPDMLVIIRIDDIDDIGEEETTRRLPSARWVEDYAAELGLIFGEERFREVLQASKNAAVVSRMLCSYLDHMDDDDEFEFLDLTACDKECGYCGQCEY